jgi:hypothetical protein
MWEKIRNEILSQPNSQYIAVAALVTAQSIMDDLSLMGKKNYILYIFML